MGHREEWWVLVRRALESKDGQVDYVGWAEGI